jgi:hypothetical protein
MSEAISKIVKQAISEGRLSHDDLAKSLGMTKVSAYRRIREANWKVRELDVLEREYGLRFPSRGMSVVSKNDTDFPETIEKKSKGIKISIEIDPENFNPDDLVAIMKILNKKMEDDFQKEK